MNITRISGCCLFTLLLVSCGSSKKTSGTTSQEIVVGTAPAGKTPVPVKTYDALQKKYAAYLNVAPEQISNIRLYEFIDHWLYTPYLWGGTTKKGVDCSSLIQQLLQNVYNITIPRTSVDQFFTDWIDKFGSTQYLSEGDLVFFRTNKEKVVSHVGLYLGNRMFVNASSSKGVSIANLDDPYWRKMYVGAGRVKVSLLPGYKK
ncbi:MAG: C40 family peptidase [Bacteroidota bacterium]